MIEQKPASIKRLRRGDTRPERDGLVFFRYKDDREVWVTPEVMARKLRSARAVDKRWKSSEAGQSYMREFFREYNHLPKQVKYRAEFFQKNKERDRHKRNEQAKKWQKTAKGKAAKRRGDIRRRDKINAWRREYNKRIRSTPEGKLHHNTSTRIHSVFRNLGKKHKRGRTAAMLGCDFKFFRGWIEAQFKPGMTWDNHGSKPGQWEVDHITPIRGFDITDSKQSAKAFHYTNCAPMWSRENRAKSDFIEHEGSLIRAREIRNIIPFTKAA